MGKPFRLRSQSAVKNGGFKMMGSTFAMKTPYRAVTDTDDDKKNIVWEDEQLVDTTVTETDEGTTTVKTFETKGTSEDPALTEFKDRCAKYGGVNSPEAAADGCVWVEGKLDPEVLQHVKSREETEFEGINGDDGGNGDGGETETTGCGCTATKPDGSTYFLPYSCNPQTEEEIYTKTNADLRCRDSSGGGNGGDNGLLRGGTGITTGGGGGKKRGRKWWKRRKRGKNIFEKIIGGVKKLCDAQGNCWDDPGTSM
jgi:hypothetical protein